LAGLSPNSSNIQRTKRAVEQHSHLVVHPEFEYWRPEWMKIRDVLAGQREVKRKGAVYLRPMKGSDAGDYEEYLHRALFYNMSGQTLAGMVGQVFRREPVIRNLPAKFVAAVRRFAKDGTSHTGMAKTTVTEQIALGRFGMLIDAPASLSQVPTSYAVGYAAENICDWTIEDVDGFFQPTRILLREFERWDNHGLPSAENPWIGQEQKTRRKGAKTGPVAARNAQPATARASRYASSYLYRTIYRELLLEPQFNAAGEIVGRVYKQNVYVEDPSSLPRDSFTPNIRGNPLSFIPFVFFGAGANAADVEKPPLLDIVDLNLSHYRTYAELEHGRFYTALPTYYSPGNQDNDAAEYHIGPGTVWEVPEGQAPGILEFKGEGLKTLERALNTKEAQIAAIGGRLMPGMSKSTSESNNQSHMREANEQALLLNVIMSLEDGMTMALRYWMMFRDLPLSQTETVRYEIDTTFLSLALDARGLRAMQLMYEGGVLPIDVFFEYLQKAEVIPATMSLEEFKAKMDDPESFIGQPDAIAMRNGFSSRQQQLDQTHAAREADFQQQELDLQQQELDLQAEAMDQAAKIAAAGGPKPPPAGIQAPKVGQPALSPKGKKVPKPGAKV
jgi:hypothetical protein